MSKRRQNHETTARTLGRLVELFPAVFRTWTETPLPLKIGIYADIRARVPDLPAKHLHNTLYRYTTTMRYLHVLVAGAERFDLDGNACGHVTSEQDAIAETARLKRSPKPRIKQAA